MARLQGSRPRGWRTFLLVILSTAIYLISGGRPAHAGSPWLPPVSISPANAAASNPSIVVAADGTVYVVWESGGYLWHTRRTNGQWQTPQQGLLGSSPDLATAGKGIFMVYTGTRSGAHPVYLAGNSGGAWLPLRAVSSLDAVCEAPRLAVGAAGQIAVTWTRNTGSAWPTLYYGVSTGGLPFSEAVLYPYAQATMSFGRHPAIAADAAGGLRIAWESPAAGTDTPAEILYAWQANQGWVIPRFVSQSAGVVSQWPDIALDPSGTAHFAWQEGPADKGEIYYDYGIDKRGTGGGVLISSGMQRARSPRLAIGPNGAVYALWDEHTTLQFRSSPAAGQGWSPAETVSTALEISGAAMDVDGNGTIHAVWAQRDPNGALLIYYSARGQTEETPTPTAVPPTPTASPQVPTNTSTATPVAPTHTATATPVPPSSTPTATPVLPDPTELPSAYPGKRTATSVPTGAAGTSTPSPSPTPDAVSTPSGTATSTPTPRPTPEAGYLIALPRAERLAGPAGVATVPPGARVATVPTAVAAVAGRSPRASVATSAPLRLTDGAVSARGPAVAVSASGAAHVVWEQEGELYHSYLKDGTWTAPVHVATGESPSLAAGTDGSMHLVFVNEFGGNFEIYHVRWNGTSWSLPRNVSHTSSGASSLPDIAVDAGNGVHIVWADTSPGYSVIYYATGYPGPFEALPIANARGSAPAVALTNDGQVSVHVVWQDHDTPSSALEVYYSVLEDGTWALPQNISASADADSRSPDIAGEGSEVRIVWQEDGTGRSVRAARGHDGWWPVPDTLSPEEDAAYLPSVSSDGRISAAAWDTGSGVRLSVWWSYASVWPQAQTVVDGVEEAADVAVAIGPGNVAHLVWAQRAGTSWSVYYAASPFKPAFVAHLPLAMH